MKIKEINFGSVDGMNEAKDPRFSEMFYEKGGYYSKLLDTNKFIIIGRKGTGKTTLSSYFALKTNSYNNHVSKQLFANDFIEKKLVEFAQLPINIEEQSLFWEYIFYIELGETLVNFFNKLSYFNLKKYRKKDKRDQLSRILKNELKKIEKTVTDSGQSISTSLKVSASKIPSFTTGVDGIITGNESVSQIRASYYDNLKILKELVLELLGFSGCRITIFYDDMDQLEEIVELDYFFSLMKGMLYAAEKVNNELFRCSKSKICLVLREDILDMLQSRSNNLNKPITDLGIRIEWLNANNPKDHPLMKMVLHKIKKSNGHESETNLEDIYLDMFEKKVFEIMLERSFGRPRDIIAYLNIYKDKNPEMDKFTFSEIKNIEKSYSKWFYDELMNEISILENRDDVIRLIHIISQRGYKTFNYKQLEGYLQRNDIRFDNLLETLTLMREYSIIGIKINKKIYFAYRENLSTDVTIESKFVVHFGLQKYLNFV